MKTNNNSSALTKFIAEGTNEELLTHVLSYLTYFQLAQFELATKTDGQIGHPYNWLLLQQQNFPMHRSLPSNIPSDKNKMTYQSLHQLNSSSREDALTRFIQEGNLLGLQLASVIPGETIGILAAYHDSFPQQAINDKQQTALDYIYSLGLAFFTKTDTHELIEQTVIFPNAPGDVNQFEWAFLCNQIDQAVDLFTHLANQTLNFFNMSLICSDEFLTKFLSQAVVNLSATDKNNRTLLHIASYRGLEKTLHTVLTRHDALINAKSETGETALHLAAANGHDDISTLLMTHPDIDVSAKDEFGNTALHSAIQRNHMAIADSIVAKMKIGTGNDKEDNSSDTALSNLNYLLMFELSDLALPHNIEIGPAREISNQLKFSSNANAPTLLIGRLLYKLMHATKSEASTLAISALAKVNPNARHKTLHTPLINAVTNRKNWIVDILIKCKADVSATVKKSGFTALHIAVKNGDYRLVEKLINAEANVNAQAHNNQTPLDLSTPIDYISNRLIDAGGVPGSLLELQKAYHNCINEALKTSWGNKGALAGLFFTKQPTVIEDITTKLTQIDFSNPSNENHWPSLVLLNEILKKMIDRKSACRHEQTIAFIDQHVKPYIKLFDEYTVYRLKLGVNKPVSMVQ